MSHNVRTDDWGRRVTNEQPRSEELVARYDEFEVFGERRALVSDPAMSDDAWVESDVTVPVTP